LKTDEVAVPTLTKRRRHLNPLPDGVPSEPVGRISVEQYHRMVQTGIIDEDAPFELLEGWLVRKMAKGKPHVVAGKLVRKALVSLVPHDWDVQIQDPITLFDSEPEPDVTVVLDKGRDYLNNHPGPDDVGLVIEISETSLARDKGWKKQVYARDRIPQYWVVNLPDSVIEVFSDSTGPAKRPDYRQHQVYSARQRVPIVLAGKKIGTLLVAEVLP